MTIYVGLPVVTNGTFTDWGHLIAFGIGLAVGLLVRPDRAYRRHGLVLVGAGLLAVAAACGVLLFTVPDREFAVPPRRVAVAKTQRVSPDPLFGAMAVAGAVTGTGLLVLAGRSAA
jgi:hypothetical protein